MKVLQINCVYNQGSTGKLVHDIHTQLQKNKVRSVVYYGIGPEVKDRHVKKLIASEVLLRINVLQSKLTGYVYGGCGFSTWKMKRYIESEKPDVVHLQCINGYMVNIYGLLTYLKRKGIPTILTIHAEFMFTAGCSYALECNKWKTGCGNCPEWNHLRPRVWFFDKSSQEWRKMFKAFRGFSNLTVVSVSPWLNERVKSSLFFKGRRRLTIFNGIDTKNVFHPVDSDILRNKLGLKDEKVLLHVTASFTDPLKGGHYVLQLADRLRDDNVKIVIAGADRPQGTHAKNIIFLGKILDQKKLAMLYSMADITVLTSLKETFSMVCAESLACGTPMVGFCAGAPEMISLPDFSQFVEQGNVDELVSCVRQWLKKSDIDYQRMVLEAEKAYAKEKMFGAYLKLYNDLHNDIINRQKR